MAKPEWGTKRTCHSCGARFFDLRRDTIVCPVCDTVYDPERQARTRRGGSAIRDEVVAVSRVDDDALKKKAKSKTTDDAVAAVDTGDDLDADDGEDSEDSQENNDEGDVDEIKAEDSDLIEDTSDLGEDDDDIGEVMEHLDDDVEDKA